jgi:asparagine synthase (glutamine-hydrolysing)
MVLYRENAERESHEARLEERHPFLDRRVVEFSLGIPDDQRRRGMLTRYVVRRALADLLPPSIRARRSSGSGSARVARGIEALGGAALFDHLALAREGWLRQDEISSMYRRLRRRFEARDPAYNEDAYPLWIIGGAELWYRGLLAGSTPQGAGCAPAIERVSDGTQRRGRR